MVEQVPGHPEEPRDCVGGWKVLGVKDPEGIQSPKNHRQSCLLGRIVKMMVGDINRGLGRAQGWGRKGGVRERDKDEDGERQRDKENQGRESGGRERRTGGGREGGKQAGRKGKGRGDVRKEPASLHTVLLSAASKTEAHQGTSPHMGNFPTTSFLGRP